MIVPPSGPRSARIVVVGEAPGREEVAQQKPFVGASGKLLRQLMVQVGIDPSSVYYTNVLKIQPPLNDFGVYYEDRKRTRPRSTLVAAYRELHSELKALRPNIILCAGGEALKAVAGKSGIKKWRGSILSTPYGKCMGTLHPAAILREYGAHTILKFDLRRVHQESGSSYCKLPQYDFVLKPSIQDVRDYLSKCTVRVAIDIETCGSRTRSQRSVHQMSWVIEQPKHRTLHPLHVYRRLRLQNHKLRVYSEADAQLLV
jgi:uracil-DNA glycosylase family 4